MVLNWPEAVLILGLVAIGVFRAPLARLVERTEKIKDWLVAPKQPALQASPDQALPTRDAEEEQRALEELTRDFDNQILLIQEESIRADLAKHKLTAESACEKVLVRHLAGTQVVLAFAEIYHLIYKSQVEALRWLNGQTQGVEAKALRPFYQRAAAAWPVVYKEFPFSNWLAFLAARGLVSESEESAQTPDDAEPFGLQITVMGRAFLGYLINAGRADPPAG